jgi:hypothetical protein
MTPEQVKQLKMGDKILISKPEFAMTKHRDRVAIVYRVREDGNTIYVDGGSLPVYNYEAELFEKK